jgi:hypothetical protein
MGVKMTEPSGKIGSLSNLTASSLAKEMKSLFGPPPLGPGDDSLIYETLQFRLFLAIKPRDIIDLLWLRDCVDIEYEIHRLRCAKPWIINLSMKPALCRIFQLILTQEDVEGDLEKFSEAAKMADEWFMNPDCRPGMRAIAGKYDIDIDMTMRAEAIALCGDRLEMIDRQVALAERRRDAIIDAIESRREANARRLRAEKQGDNARLNSDSPPRQLEDQRREKSPDFVPSSTNP